MPIFKINETSLAYEDIGDLDQKIAIAYIGVVGKIMEKSLSLLFKCMQSINVNNPLLLKHFHFYFIGTSYASKGTGKNTVLPVAKTFGVSEFIEEQTDRISYFETIKTILDANALIIPGSNEKNYTASKLYPYVLANKPLFSIFSKESSTYEIIKNSNCGTVIDIDEHLEKAISTFTHFLTNLLSPPVKVNTNWDYFKNYSSEVLTRQQCHLFDPVFNQQHI